MEKADRHLDRTNLYENSSSREEQLMAKSEKRLKSPLSQDYLLTISQPMRHEKRRAEI